MTQGKERVAFEIQPFVFFKDLLGLVVRQVVSTSRYVAADTDFKAGTDVWVEISLLCSKLSHPPRGTVTTTQGAQTSTTLHGHNLLGTTN